MWVSTKKNEAQWRWYEQKLTTKKPRSIRNPVWVSYESMTHRFSENGLLRLHTTKKWGTARNRIHLFLRLKNINSGALCMKKSSLSLLLPPQGTEDRTTKLAAVQTVSIRTISGFVFIATSSFLSSFSTGISRGSGEALGSPSPASWMKVSPRDEPTSFTSTTISSVMTDFTSLEV